MSALIAVVEDDADQRHNYAEALRRRGHRPLELGDLEGARQQLTRQRPDLALLDVMLGDAVDGGFELCRFLHQAYPGLPVIFLTSRDDEIDQVLGLRLGAWDYQTKPVSLRLLVERVEAMLRILQVGKHQAPQQLGPLSLEMDALRVLWKGQPVPLTLTECHLLERIVARAGAVASYDDLAAATRQTLVTNNTINTHVRHIRRKFERLDPEFQALENVYGAGYRWLTAG